MIKKERKLNKSIMDNTELKSMKQIPPPSPSKGGHFQFSIPIAIGINSQFLFCFSLLVLSSSLAFGQSDTGFVNRHEAKNITIGGAKDGKWVEYVDSAFYAAKDSNAPYYILTIYKFSKPFGLVRTYYKNGALYCTTPYSDGVPNGVAKMFYKSGHLQSEIPYLEGKLNGLLKKYYENGQLGSESPFTDNHLDGLVKYYYEDGKIRTEIMYAGGKQGVIRNYDEKGNEVK
jgi:MORN repeat protein